MSPPDPVMPPPTKRRGKVKPPPQEVLLQVCAAISMGAALLANGFSVGPMTTAEGTVWVCLDRQARPVAATQWARRWVVHPQDAAHIPHPGLLNWLYHEDHETLDTSAFGAARAFLNVVGERAARRALTRLSEAS